MSAWICSPGRLSARTCAISLIAPRAGPGSVLWPKPAPKFRADLTVRRATARGDSEAFDEFTTRALREAVQLLKEAQSLAAEQTRSELLQSWEASEPSPSSHSETEAPDYASKEFVLRAFWEEQGLNRQHAARLTSELQKDPVAKRWSLQLLAAKLNLLERILPDSSIAQLAYQHHQVLQVSSHQAVQVVVTLLDAMPEGTNVISMLEKQPKLLCSNTKELVDRVQRVLDKLEQLHPSSDRNVVAGIVEENPELLFRMDYYMDAMLLDDLPIEIQNMMVLADQGLGFLYRYYNTKRKDNQQTQQQQAQQQQPPPQG